jgi:hypothetical protein
MLAAVVVGASAFSLQAPLHVPAPPAAAAARSATHGRSRAGVPGMKWDIDIAPWKLEYGLQEPRVELPAGAEAHGKPAPFSVTDAQRAQLLEDGAVLIPGLLCDEWLAYLRSITEWQVANPHVWSVAGVASGLYDYIQRSVWASNSGFAKFMYYSPLASALADVSGAKELRLATDLLMVNPNKGFKWHQDNQNGPIDAFAGGRDAHDAPHNALRWWVTMDETPADHGAPVYLKVRTARARLASAGCQAASPPAVAQLLAPESCRRITAPWVHFRAKEPTATLAPSPSPTNFIFGAPASCPPLPSPLPSGSLTPVQLRCRAHTATQPCHPTPSLWTWSATVCWPTLSCSSSGQRREI